MNNSVIHLRVPKATKGRWVRASRAAGMRLTDWIEEAVEAHMQNQIVRCETPTPEQIRAAREAAGLTQQRAADLMCTDKRTWQRWEAGDRKMSPRDWKLFRIEAAKE